MMNLTIEYTDIQYTEQAWDVENLNVQWIKTALSVFLFGLVVIFNPFISSSTHSQMCCDSRIAFENVLLW